jgi:hypothetical protein
MTVQLKTLDSWAQTRDTLVETLTLTLGVLQTAPWSDDPASPYRKAQATDATVLEAIHHHAVVGLEQIDDTIAAGPLIQQIDAAATAAQEAANRIAATTHMIDDVIGAVTLATGVVAKFAALPFV